MPIEKPHTQLYEKMYVEQEQYRQWLLTQSPEEILKHAYEFTIREDILLSLEYNELPTKQAKALLKSPPVLWMIYSGLGVKWKLTIW